METCKTLGADGKRKIGNQYFKFSYCPNELTLIWGFTKNKPKFAIIKDDLIKKVILRVNNMLANNKVNSRTVGYY